MIWNQYRLVEYHGTVKERRLDVRPGIVDNAARMARRVKRVLVVTRMAARGEIERRQAERAREAHEEHLETLSAVRSALRRQGLAHEVVKAVERIDIRRFDLVLTVGGDGTVLYASHHVDSIPILGVRSSHHSAGYLTGAERADVEAKLARFAAGSLEATIVHRMSVHVGGRLRHDKVLNEALFSHPNPAVTTRYVLKYGRWAEEQMSSGIWVGPAAGSTAAMRSAGGRVLAPTSRDLQFVVREPIRRPGSRMRLEKGIVTPGRDLRIVNMLEHARLYLDGPHLQIPVGPGEVVRASLSGAPLAMLGWPSSG